MVNSGVCRRAVGLAKLHPVETNLRFDLAGKPCSPRYRSAADLLLALMTGVCPYNHVPRFAVHSSESNPQMTATKIGGQTVEKLIVQALAQLVA